MEKLLEGDEHIVCFFCFFALLLWYFNCGISFWIIFNWPEYGISLFAEHILREFLTAEFDSISCKATRSRGRLTILYLFIVNMVTSVVCSITIYLPFIQVISIFQKCLENSNKSPLDATSQ